MIQFIFDHGIYVFVGALFGSMIGSAVRHFLIKYGVITKDTILTFTDFFPREVENDMASVLSEDKEN